MEALERLVPQVEPFAIPIYISDNHSDDDTVAAVEEFAVNRYRYIYINSNLWNMGFAENLRAAIAMANSKYVWLMSDDDAIMEGALSRVMLHLEGEPSAIILNTSIYDQALDKLLLERTFYQHEDIEYAPGQHEDILLSVPPFYMGVIILRSLWSDISAQVDTEIWPHTAVFLRAIVGRRVFFLAEPLIKIRAYNESYSSRKFEIFCIELPRVIWGLPESYSDCTKMRMISPHRYRLISEVIISKSVGWLKWDNCHSVFLDLNINKYRLKMIELIIRYAPLPICQLFTVCYLGIVMLFSGEILRFRPRKLSSLRWAMSLSWLSFPRWKGKMKKDSNYAS